MTKEREASSVTQTEEYIMQHAIGVHTYESFGHNFVYNALMSAVEHVREKGATDEIALDVQVRVTPIKETKCELICVYFPLLNVTYCMHADITT